MTGRIGRRLAHYRTGDKKKKFLNAETLNNIEKRLARLEYTSVGPGLRSEYTETGQYIALEERIDNFEFGMLTETVSPYSSGIVRVVENDLVTSVKGVGNEDLEIEAFELCGDLVFVATRTSTSESTSDAHIPVMLYRLPRSNSGQYGFIPCKPPGNTDPSTFDCLVWVWCCVDDPSTSEEIEGCYCGDGIINPIVCPAGGEWRLKKSCGECIDEEANKPPIDGRFRGETVTICPCPGILSSTSTSTSSECWECPPCACGPPNCFEVTLADWPETSLNGKYILENQYDEGLCNYRVEMNKCGGVVSHMTLEIVSESGGWRPFDVQYKVTIFKDNGDIIQEFSCYFDETSVITNADCSLPMNSIHLNTLFQGGIPDCLINGPPGGPLDWGRVSAVIPCDV